MSDIQATCPIKARDVMQTQVVSLSPDDTLEEALRALLVHSISGAPVTDAENRVVGVISEFALMDLLFDPAIRSAHVADYMTDEVHTVDEDDPATKLAHIFALFRIRRLPVLRDGRLVGVVARRDLLERFYESEFVVAEPLPATSMFDFDDVALPRR